MKHLLIGDPHAHPEYSNERFTALGRFIMDERPDVIVCIGDFADMPSLSSYDRGKRSFEGRRYKKDIDAVQDAMVKLLTPMDKYNRMRYKNKKSRYTPRMVMTLGNHEDRIKRVSQLAPELEGVVSLNDLKYRHYGWEEVDYNDGVVIDGFAYSHAFATGVSGRPISGENIGKSLVQKNLMSSVQGHSHVFDHSVRTNVYGQRLHGLSIGCYANPDMVEGWNQGTHHMWWYGVVVLDDVRYGDFGEIRVINQERLLNSYL
jgi:hypothetical protein